MEKRSKNIPDIDQPSLTAIFNAFAAKTVQDFPRLKGRFAILDTKAHDIHGDIDLEKTGFKDESSFFKFLNTAINASAASNVSVAKRAQNKKLLMIVFNGAMPATLDGARDVIKTLDHELGHLVVPDAIGGDPDDISHTMFKECAADAFSCLRDLKKNNGKDTGLIARLSWRRTIRFVRNEHAEHFTLPALLMINQIKDSIDFNRLTPKQMVRLSRDIASASTLSDTQINALKEAFAPLHRDQLAPIDLRVLKAGTHILSTATDPLVIRTAHAFIAPYIKTGRKFFGEKLDMSESYRKNMIRLLDEKITAHPAPVPANILSSIPRRKPGKGFNL